MILLMIIGMPSCEKSDSDPFLDMSVDADYLSSQKFNGANNLPMATGSVEFLWKGGEKGGDMGNKPENLLAFFDFNAHEGNNVKAPKGDLVYRVINMDLSPHREIRAVITGVDIIGTKVYFIGVVISDTKGCIGDGNGGHDSNCSGSDHTDEGGGCGEETDGHDGGCSDGGTDEGGCSDGGTDEGGCTDGGAGEEGNGSEPGSGSPGGTMGNPLSGKNCRLGQIIAVKVHDVATPGIGGDGLTWKWFDPDGAFVPSTDNIESWPHLCKKTIVGGNIVVHI